MTDYHTLTPAIYFAKFSRSDVESLAIIVRTRYGVADGPIWQALVEHLESEVARRHAADGDAVPIEPLPFSMPLQITPAEAGKAIEMLTTLILAHAVPSWQRALGQMLFVVSNIVARF